MVAAFVALVEAGLVFRPRCLAGDADAVLSAAGDGLISAFLCARCLAGEGDALGESLGVGDWALIAHVPARPTMKIRVRILEAINPSLERSRKLRKKNLEPGY